MKYRDPRALPQAALRGRRRPYAIWAAAAVTILVLAELVVLDVCLAWGAMGLWGLGEAAATAFAAVGLLGSLWAGWRTFRAAYRVETECLDHDLPRRAERT